MGVTYVQARLRKPYGRRPTRNVRFLVDSGAIYSVLPEEIWRALRLRAERQVDFTLADGTPIERSVSECRFEIRGKTSLSQSVDIYLHVVCECADPIYAEFVTAYIPDELEWEKPPFRRRKKEK